MVTTEDWTLVLEPLPAKVLKVGLLSPKDSQSGPIHVQSICERARILISQDAQRLTVRPSRALLCPIEASEVLE